MKESTIEQYLVSKSKENNCLCYKFSSPARRGVPDRIVIWPDGTLDFIELKTKDGVLSKLQRHELKRLTGHYQRCFVLDSIEAIDRHFADDRHTTTPA